MPKRRRRHVDPLRVHLITLVVFGVIAGVALAVWTFPKFFGVLALVVVGAIVYSKLFTLIEARLEAEEGRLAEELGFDLGDEDDEELLPPVPRPKRKRKKTASTAVVAKEGNGSPAPGPAVTPVEPPPTTVPSSGSTPSAV